MPTMAKGEFQSLGRWVSAQRKEYVDLCSNCDWKYDGEGVRGQLIDRVQRLKNIGFQFAGLRGTYLRKVQT